VTVASRAGYLIREPDPRNSRRRRIRLTAKGRQLEAVMWAAARQAEENAAVGYEPVPRAVVVGSRARSVESHS
jgi:DNA-binding MarR family transcriptional regulator